MVTFVNRYLPNGVLNVQSFEPASSSFTWQYPEVALRTENTFAWGISATTSSIVVIGKYFLLIVFFISLGSMQMRNFLGSTTVTILFTQSIGSFYFTTTSEFSILSSSFLIFSLSWGNGHFSWWMYHRGNAWIKFDCVHLEGNLGLEIALSIAHTSLEPSPWDTFKRLCCWSRCTRPRRPRSLQVWAPRTVGASISATREFNWNVLPLHSQGNVITPLVGIRLPVNRILVSLES